MSAHQIAFFSVAATVIPVLFLALVYQRGFFEAPHEAIDPMSDLIALFAFAVGEMLSLYALATGKASAASFGLSSLAILVGGFAIIGPIAWPRLGRMWREAQPHLFFRPIALFLGLGIFAVPAAIVLFLLLRGMFD